MRNIDRARIMTAAQSTAVVRWCLPRYRATPLRTNPFTRIKDAIVSVATTGQRTIIHHDACLERVGRPNTVLLRAYKDHRPSTRHAHA